MWIITITMLMGGTSESGTTSQVAPVEARKPRVILARPIRRQRAPVSFRIQSPLFGPNSRFATRRDLDYFRELDSQSRISKSDWRRTLDDKSYKSRPPIRIPQSRSGPFASIDRKSAPWWIAFFVGIVFLRILFGGRR